MAAGWPDLPHLVRRFTRSLWVTPLGPREQTEVAALLRPEERDLFWAQPGADRRHGLGSARRVLAAAPGRRDLARAALLHDVGKRHARLGVIGRSLASGFDLFGVSLRGRFAAYRDHGRQGAADLARAGAEPLVVNFARHHHDGVPPDTIDPADWAALVDADLE